MIDLATLTEFLGWCAIINIGLLALTSLILLGARGLVLSLHEKFTGVPAE